MLIIMFYFKLATAQPKKKRNTQLNANKSKVSKVSKSTNKTPQTSVTTSDEQMNKKKMWDFFYHSIIC